jgi:hypothetical protein
MNKQLKKEHELKYEVEKKLKLLLLDKLGFELKNVIKLLISIFALSLKLLLKIKN